LEVLAQGEARQDECLSDFQAKLAAEAEQVQCLKSEARLQHAELQAAWRRAEQSASEAQRITEQGAESMEALQARIVALSEGLGMEVKFRQESVTQVVSECRAAHGIGTSSDSGSDFVGSCTAPPANGSAEARRSRSIPVPKAANTMAAGGSPCFSDVAVSAGPSDAGIVKDAYHPTYLRVQSPMRQPLFPLGVALVGMQAYAGIAGVQPLSVGTPHASGRSSPPCRSPCPSPPVPGFAPAGRTLAPTGAPLMTPRPGVQGSNAMQLVPGPLPNPRPMPQPMAPGLLMGPSVPNLGASPLLSPGMSLFAPRHS